MSREPTIVLLGSNIEPRRHLVAAAKLLAARFEILGCSRVFSSPPVGAAGPRFHNAAVRLRTELAPCELHFGALRAIEAELGRRRGADPNAPRKIDLDLVVYGSFSGSIDCGAEDGRSRWLRLPDPDIARHAHAAVPIADLVPELRLDGAAGRTIAEMAAELVTPAIRPVGVLAFGPSAP